MITEIKGDLFKSDKSLAHCVSKDLKMGKGIALIFRNTFKEIDNLKSQNKGLYEVAYIKVDDRYIFYMITKERYYYKPTYNSLKNTLIELKRLCVELKVKEIAMPRIGCGLDRLEWVRVKRMLFEIFKDDIDIEIFYL